MKKITIIKTPDGRSTMVDPISIEGDFSRTEKGQIAQVMIDLWTAYRDEIDASRQCTRALRHDGPCNGLPKPNNCLVLYKDGWPIG